MSTVLLATQHLEDRGGVGVHVGRVRDALRDAGQPVHVVAGRVAGESRGDDVHELPGLEARKVDTGVLDEVGRLAASLSGPVVTHLHHLWDAELVTRLRRHGPVVWNVHEFAACPTGEYHFEPGHECHRAHGPGCIPHILFHGCAHTRDLRSMPRRYRRAAEHVRIMKASDAVLAYSGFVAKHVRRNGIQAVRVAPLIVPAPAEPIAPPKGNRVLFAGRLTPNKGLQTLLAAARDLEAQIDVVGDGWWRRQAELLSSKFGVQDRVRFHGFQPAASMGGFYERASVVAVPSLWPEPFGMVGPEAMAYGRPVVGSDTGGIPEWLAHGRTGFLVPPGDDRALANAIQTLLADQELSRRMGEAGASRVVDRYSPRAHSAALRDLHRELQRQA